MTIASRKITTFTKLVASLADRPSLGTTALLKQWFDSSPEELRVALDGLIDDLLATTPGASGADNIGSSTIVGVTGSTVYTQLVALKTLVDGLTSGSGLADGAVTSVKIADGTIATNDISDSAITSAKIADGTIVNVDINSSAAIDATKIGAGTVNNTKLGYLSNVTSDVQTQLDAKPVNSFLNIAVSGQSTVVADSPSDTLTLVGSGIISITTDAITDTITIQAAGVGTGTVTNVSSPNSDIAVSNPASTPVLTLNSGSGANQIVKRDGSGNIITTTPAAGDNSTKVPTTAFVASAIAANTTEYNLKTQGGCVGDGVTDDTANFRTALSYAQSNGLTLFIPKGTYLVDKIDYGSQTNAHQISIIGEDRLRTIIQKKTSDGQDLFVIGNASGTNYIGNITIKNITFQGVAGNTPSALKLYDVVRSELLNVRCTSAINGLDFQGCVAVELSDCLCDFNQYGWHLTHFASSAGGGYPNINTAYSSQFTDNTKWGVWFDYGRLLNLNDCEIEGNGTTSDATTGGLYVGSNVGAENAILDIGVNVKDSWFEANAGDAAIQLNYGRNELEDCYFVANANATNDIHVKGGRYNTRVCFCATTKTANLLEDAGVGSGNTNFNSVFPGITYDGLKTMLIYGSGTGLHIAMRNGEAPTVSQLASPFMQQGNDSTASGVVNITFPVAFASTTGLVINVTMNNNSSGTLDAPEVYSVTTAGFTVRKKSITSGSATVGTTNAGFYWTAIGTK